MCAREDKGLGWKAVYKWNQFSRTNGRWPKGKAICNSAAMSWGFAISHFLSFVYLIELQILIFMAGELQIRLNKEFVGHFD